MISFLRVWGIISIKFMSVSPAGLEVLMSVYVYPVLCVLTPAHMPREPKTRHLVVSIGDQSMGS